MSKRKSLSILEEADKLVTTDRQNDYGHPAEDFARAAALWSAIIGKQITPRQIALCMIAIKISRECHRHKRDNLVDIAGYAKTLQMLEDYSS